jgi:hypothetical protein
MTIEQKLEIIKKALEKGAYIQVNFHWLKEEEDATNIMNDFNLDYEIQERNGTQWAKHQSPNYDFEVSAFYDGEEEVSFIDEDVDLSGGELEEILKEDMRSEEYVSSFDLKLREGL